ncbi:uncharacterized protein LOC134286523 [Aedes albopictus]|uniref:Integrase catalytic domain-containing protein n=1 Tax=Aedes albopictus TaxID=7160 RepID=A0ABM1YEZ8_AEDAL
MYHQLRIRDADKQAQRFLFRFDSTDPPVVYIMDVATFGATCSPCSAQFIKNRNALEHSTQFPDAASAIVDRTYVDDYFDSLDSEEEALQRAKEVRFIIAKAGFEVRNWSSNSPLVLNGLGEEGSTELVHFHQDKATENERVLGVIWNPQLDTLSFAVPSGMAVSSIHSTKPTKRVVLSSVMTLFDPLGLLAPFTSLGKMLVQDLWRSGYDWDQEVDDDSYNKWRSWVSALPEIASLKIPRSYFGTVQSTDFGHIQLHIFCDAGENAFGCAGYLRIEVDGLVKCSLVMARTKVAPLKQLTIPRLELQAAVLGSRMSQQLKQHLSLKVDQTFFWTDSRTVLSWIASDQKRYKQFVSFRIGEILSLTKLSEWRWISSKMNIADCLTKWRSDCGLVPEWFRGPNFLYQSQETWPRQQLPPTNTKAELRAVHLFHDVTFPDKLIDATKFSKWNVLVRTLASALRFISNCQRKIRGESIETLKPTKNQQHRIISGVYSTRVPLKQNEYQRAETLLFRSAQYEYFGDKITTLLKNVDLEPSKWITLEKSSTLYKLTPLIDSEKVLRMEGRCDRAENLPFDMRFPVILPRDGPVTELLVRHYHEAYGHAFRETVKNEIKQRFLIISVNTVLAKVERSCNWCKVRKSLPKVPRMVSIPVQRLTPYKRPFTFVGIDYLGPVQVSVGRRSEKRWIVLFTCLVVRAIHLEVAHNLTAQSCTMAIRRFICRRGPAAEYFSDNGTNLKAASKEFVQQWQEISAECAEEFTSARTKWHFNPPAAPHMGGIWERMVRTVKNVMAVLNDGRRLNDEILLTTLAETEDMVNSRPLVYISQGALQETLSPNHFLRGTAANEPHEVLPPTDPASALRDTYQRSVELSNNLWERWLKEYTPSINRRSKWFDESTPLRKGDLVYIVDGNRRKAWIRGIVEEPIAAGDGRIRQAIVRTNYGLVKRATANLAVLEIEGSNAAPDCGSGTGLRAGDVFGISGQPCTAEHTDAPVADATSCDQRLAARKRPRTEPSQVTEIPGSIATQAIANYSRTTTEATKASILLPDRHVPVQECESSLRTGVSIPLPIRTGTLPIHTVCPHPKPVNPAAHQTVTLRTGASTFGLIASDRRHPILLASQTAFHPPAAWIFRSMGFTSDSTTGSMYPQASGNSDLPLGVVRSRLSSVKQESPASQHPNKTNQLASIRINQTQSPFKHSAFHDHLSIGRPTCIKAGKRTTIIGILPAAVAVANNRHPSILPTTASYTDTVVKN